MKKVFSLLLLTGIVVLFLTNIALAEIISGELIGIEGSFYTVKDNSGKKYRVHFNDSTKKEGEIKTGVIVDIEIDDGRPLPASKDGVAVGYAKSIKVVCVRPGGPPPCPPPSQKNKK